MVPRSKAEEYDDLDDQLHTFTAADRDDLSSGFDLFSARGWANALTLLVMASALVGIFAVYPIVDYYFRDNSSSGGNSQSPVDLQPFSELTYQRQVTISAASIARASFPSSRV